jgi:hypothetical protein
VTASQPRPYSTDAHLPGDTRMTNATMTQDVNETKTRKPRIARATGRLEDQGDLGPGRRRGAAPAHPRGDDEARPERPGEPARARALEAVRGPGPSPRVFGAVTGSIGGLIAETLKIDRIGKLNGPDSSMRGVGAVVVSGTEVVFSRAGDWFCPCSSACGVVRLLEPHSAPGPAASSPR